MEYIVGMIIDRTDEAILEIERERDFKSMITLMNDLLENRHNAIETKAMSEKVFILHNRLKELIKNNK